MTPLRRRFLFLLAVLWAGSGLVSPAWGQAKRKSPAARPETAPPAKKAEELPEEPPLPGRNKGYSLAFHPAQRVRAELTFQIEAPKFDAREWVVYIAQMPVTQGQTDVSSALEPSSKPAGELSPEKRAVLLARVSGSQPETRHGLSVRAEYQATLWARKLVPRPSGRTYQAPPPLGPEERRDALATGNEFDLDSPGFQGWLTDHQLRRGSTEAEIDFARRVFLAIKQGFTYEYAGDMDRHASKVCAARRSDCGGLAIVFAAALRANRIPARLLAGRWAFSTEEKPGRPPDQRTHVKAEFFADGVGWVPADLSSAVLHDQSPEGLVYFGNDEGNFLALHLDSALVLDTIHFGRKPAEWLQGPAYWVTGTGTFEGFTIREHWTVTPLPPRQLQEAVLKKPR